MSLFANSEDFTIKDEPMEEQEVDIGRVVSNELICVFFFPSQIICISIYISQV